MLFLFLLLPFWLQLRLSFNLFFIFNSNWSRSRLFLFFLYFLLNVCTFDLLNFIADCRLLQFQLLLLSRRVLQSRLTKFIRIALLNWEDDVKSKFERIIKHSGYEFLKNRRTFLNAGVGIDLNQPRMSVCVDHKVIAEDLKTVLGIVFI